MVGKNSCPVCSDATGEIFPEIACSSHRSLPFFTWAFSPKLIYFLTKSHKSIRAGMVYSNHQDQDQLQKSVELSKKKSQLVERSSAQWTVGTASVNIFCSVCSGRESSGESTRGKSSPHPPSPSPPSWMGRPVRGEGVMWRQLYIHFGRFLYVWTFSFSNKIKNKIRWQAQIQIQIKIKTRGNSIVYILYYIYCVIYLNKSEDVECCLFTSMFRVSTHQMGFHLLASIV